jgi:Zn-dependent membrane protease YugP
MIWIIFGVFMLLSWVVGSRLKSKFREFSKIPINYGLTGRDIAQKMLNDNGIYDVKIESVEGELTDHYNPMKKTVNLSPDVYHGRSVAAAAVSAHECGHAIQHATAYHWLQMRSQLVPVVSFSSKWVQWILLAGILTIETFPQLLLVGIIMFAMTTIFSFITLPVEIDASRRALAWLSVSGVTAPTTHPKAQEALRWAAYTYVVAALSSLATLLYYLSIYMGRRE